MIRSGLLQKRVRVLLFFLLFGVAAMACEIEFKVSEKYQKASYSPGDVLVVELQVTLVHRDCTVSITDTQIASDGCKILGATRWKAKGSNGYTRKLKVMVLSGKRGEMTLRCKRTCTKRGGFAQMSLPVKP